MELGKGIVNEAMIKKRGEVYRARLDDAEGHEQKGDKETGYRPVVIVSNNQQKTPKEKYL